MNDPLRTPTDAMPKGIRKGWILIVIAAVVSYGLYHILPYDENANKGLALLTFIAILWLTEAIHITITALLIPILAVVLAMPMAKGDELEPLPHKQHSPLSQIPPSSCFGGFALASALHIQKLDKKIATWIISLSGGHLGASVLAIF